MFPSLYSRSFYLAGCLPPALALPRQSCKSCLVLFMLQPATVLLQSLCDSARCGMLSPWPSGCLLKFPNPFLLSILSLPDLRIVPCEVAVCLSVYNLSPHLYCIPPPWGGVTHAHTLFPCTTLILPTSPTLAWSPESRPRCVQHLLGTHGLLLFNFENMHLVSFCLPSVS